MLLPGKHSLYIASWIPRHSLIQIYLSYPPVWSQISLTTSHAHLDSAPLHLDVLERFTAFKGNPLTAKADVPPMQRLARKNADAFERLASDCWLAPNMSDYKPCCQSRSRSMARLAPNFPSVPDCKPCPSRFRSAPSRCLAGAQASFCTRLQAMPISIPLCSISMFGWRQISLKKEAPRAEDFSSSRGASFFILAWLVV